MPRVLTNGEISVGAYRFSDRKLPALCIEEGNSITVVGRFNSIESAKLFMDKVAKIIGQQPAERCE